MQQVAEVTAFIANAITILLGVLALWGLYAQSTKIKLVFRVIANFYTHQRVDRLKETLNQLEQLSLDNKEERKQVRALMGRLSGQVKALKSDFPVLDEIHDTLAQLVENPRKLTETSKMEITGNLSGTLEATAFQDSAAAIFGDKNGK